MLTRREFIAAGGASLGAAGEEKQTILCAFSKHFQWAGWEEMAETVAALGFEGVDLTVRPGGHVEPARVAEDLPKVAAIVRKAGLQLPMITSAIQDASSPHAETVLKTCAELGIRLYRWEGFRYDASRPLFEQLETLRPRVQALAELNRRHGVCAIYHTHSGLWRVGASMWDLYLLLKDADAGAVAVNFDIGHATVEGGYGGWVHSARLLLPRSKGVAVKDFRWRQNEKGAWVPGWCPLGQGMVNLKQFFAMLKQSGFRGPIQLHMEYPELGGAERGDRTFRIPKPKLLEIMRRDVETLKALRQEAGLL